MATKAAKVDPLEAAKVTDEKLRSDAAALGEVKPVNPAMPPPLPPPPVAPDPLSAAAPVEVVKAPPPPPLRKDGPTIETWIAAGYAPEGYPPSGYAEKPSPGLTRYRGGAEIPKEWVDEARRAYEADARGEKPTESKRVVHVVKKEARANVGHGQVAYFRVGDELDEAGYGEHGIKKLVDQGLELERQER